MELPILYPVRRAVVARGDQDRNPKRGGVLEHLIHLLTRLRAPAIFGHPPTYRNDRRLIDGVVYRGADRIDEAAVRIWSVVDGDPCAGSDAASHLYVQHHLAVGAIRIPDWLVLRAIDRDGRHGRYR
jgi:hypothetical protein